MIINTPLAVHLLKQGNNIKITLTTLALRFSVPGLCIVHLIRAGRQGPSGGSQRTRMIKKKGYKLDIKFTTEENIQ
jgi:hypothetical protein